MEDNHKGLTNRAPMKTDQRVVLLSPALDSWKGKQFAHNPAFAGEVPANNLGLCPEHDEVSDTEFHGRRYGTDRTRRSVEKTGGVKKLGP